MDAPRVYEIRVEGCLSSRWSHWFEELAISYEPGGVMVLRGELADQAALFGVLLRIRDLGLPLLSVIPVGSVKHGENRNEGGTWGEGQHGNRGRTGG